MSSTVRASQVQSKSRESRDSKSISAQHAMSGDQRQSGGNNALVSMQKLLPNGFHKLIQKLIRVVLLGRPLRINRFIADYIDIELTKRSLAEMETSCYLQKSLRPDLHPSESCRLLMKTGGAIDKFTAGPIEEPCLELPALDRYRELDQPGVEFEFVSYIDGYMDGEIDESELDAPALDRYREIPMWEELPDDTAGGIDAFMKGSVSQRTVCVPALDRYREFEPPGIPCAATELKCPDNVASKDCIIDFECCDDDDVNEPDASQYDEELCDDIDVSVPNTFVMRVCDEPPHSPTCSCSVCRFFQTATYFFYHPEEDGTNEPEFDDTSCQSLEQRDSFQERPLGAPAWRPSVNVKGPSGPDQFMHGHIPEDDLELPALDRYRVLSAITLSKAGGTSITGQFAQGRVPEYEVRAPALDRYRAQSRLGDFVVDEKRTTAVVGDTRTSTDGPKTASIPVGPDAFMRGPIPEHELDLPALDRYREMSLVSGVKHEAGCKCIFCRSSARTGSNLAETKSSPETDQFMHGPIPENDPFGPALDRYREVSTDLPRSSVKADARTSAAEPPRTTITRVSDVGAEAFTRGPIPEHQLDLPALDRYREMSLGSGGKHEAGCTCVFCQPTSQTRGVSIGGHQAHDTRGVSIGGRQAQNDTDQFTRGPVPEYEPTGNALDRYREVEQADARTSAAGSRTTSTSAPNTDAFTKGPIPEYELDSIALDRYREFSSGGESGGQVRGPSVVETQLKGEFTHGPIPEHELKEPALDRYRMY